MYKGWFHQTTTLHWLRFICGRMAQAGGAVIDQQEGTEAGASGDDLGAPFSLLALSKSALTHHPQVAVALPAAVVRSPREVRRASLPCLVWTGQQTPPAACASGGATPMHWGLGGPSATNKLRRVYTGALLAITIIAYK